MKEIYIDLKDYTKILERRPVLIKDIATVYAEERLKVDIENIPVNKGENTEVVITSIDVIKMIKMEHHDVSITFTNSSPVLVKFEEQKQKGAVKKSLEIALLVFGSLCVFLGAGVAIMTFHTDVSMAETMERIYEFIMGHEADNLYLFQVPYSLGIVIGVTTFFSRFGKAKEVNLSPLDIEIDKYDKDLNSSHIKKIKEKNPEGV